MKNAIISFIFAVAITIASACSTARDVRVSERRNGDGTVVTKETKVYDDGTVVKKKRRHADRRIRLDKDRRAADADDKPVIIIKKDR